MKHYLWIMRPYFRQVAGALILGSLAGIVMNTAVVLPAILLGRAIDVALAMERGQATASDVGWAGLAFIGGTLLSEGPRILKRWWLITANARIRANVRADALRGILALPLADVEQTPIGDLMARVIGDVEVLGVGVREFIIETWDTLLFSLSLIVTMFWYDARLTVLVLLPTPLALLLSYAMGRWVSGRTRAAREANAGLTAVLQEQLAGLRVLRLFGRTDTAVAEVRARSQAQARANLGSIGLRSGLQPIYSALISLGIVVLVWQGGLLVIAGSMSVGAFVAYLQLYLRFIGRGFRIPQLVNSIQSGAAAYGRLQPWLAPPVPARAEPRWASFHAGQIAGIAEPSPNHPTVAAGPLAVRLEGVTFQYPAAAQPALADVWLDIPAGTLIAVTGPVGAGKSALARVLLGLFPIAHGRIVLDGIPLDAIGSNARAARIGYLPQEPVLFSGTIQENVLMTGPQTVPSCAQQRAADATIRLAALERDLQTMPAGRTTEIGELGVRVSGGQRQRIALARALAAPAAPGLLVLDDPFSAVDIDTEAQILAGLRATFGPSAPPEQRATIVLCSHRLAAFPQADQVLVLDAGRIIEQGTHVKLIAAHGVYARMYRAQQRVAEATPSEVLP
jgi:ABC-type multidrug transport system fused ATPase/permease subunit